MLAAAPPVVVAANEPPEVPDRPSINTSLTARQQAIDRFSTALTMFTKLSKRIDQQWITLDDDFVNYASNGV